MLETIVVVTLITLLIATAVITLALCKAAGKADESLEHPERINLKGE
jgi:type II secretory pathway pseudopilin PulG